MPANLPTRTPDREYYERTEKDDGTIIFTPKKKEVTGGRERLSLCSKFFFITDDGRVQRYVENKYPCNDGNFNYGNYYHTKEQAEAVADLRRHVYKFPAIKGDEKHYSLGEDGWFISDWSDDMKCYFFDWLPITATIEDQEERSRLIKRCYDLNGYVSI